MAAIAVSSAVGYPARAWVGSHTGEIGPLTTVVEFLATYPMMVNVRVEASPRG